MKKITTSLFVLAACLALAPTASGQILVDPVTPFDPGYFGNDLQFFAPGDFGDDFGNPDPPPIGWYFNYNRGIYGGSRPETSPQPNNTDAAWGNNFNFGFMTEENKGIDFRYTHIDGPVQTVINGSRFIEDGGAVTGPERFGVFDGINIAELWSGEVNRTYRLKPLEHGGFVEPYIGLRYLAFTDLSNPTAFRNQNDMFGPQLGFRWFKEAGRWTVSFDGKAYPALNFQILQTQSANEFVIAGEARLEFAFHITKQIALMTGGHFLYLGRGISRSNNINFNDQEMAYFGWTFGVNVNFP